MRTRRLSHRDRIALLAGAVAVSGVLALLSVVRPAARTFVANRDQVTEQRALLDRERALVRSGVRNAAALERLLALRESLDNVIGGVNTGTTAAMELAAYMRDLALDEGLRSVRCADLGADSLSESFRVLRLQVEAQGEYVSIVRFIRSVESDPLVMRVADVELSREGRFVAPSEQASNGGVVRVRLVVLAIGSLDRTSSTRGG